MKGLTFRLVSKSDAVELMRIWRDEEVTRYTMIQSIESIIDCETRIERQLQWIGCDSIGPFVVIKDNTLIGYCGGTKEGQDVYEIFYHLGKTNWHKGLGTAIVKALLRFGFKHKNANRIIAKVVLENTGSWKVLEKNGMKRCRTEIQAFEKGETKYDLYVYEIDREDWLSP